MDISQIKNLVRQNSDKFIMVENGEPELVVMSFDEYQKLLKNDSSDLNLRFDDSDEFRYLGRHQEPSIQTAGLESELAQETEFDPAPFADRASRDFPPVRKRHEVASSPFADSEDLDYPQCAKGAGFEIQQASEPAGLPVRLEDIKLEDLPI